MSNAVFPTLGGLDIKVKRTPLWSTEVLTSESGKEQRAAWWSTPRFKWSMGFNYLRQGLNGNEAKTLVDFFHQHRGQFESFLFADPYESAVTAKLFGTGTGAVAAYQLVDGAGYPVTEVNGTPTIYRNGALLVAGVDYTLSSTGLVTLASTTNPVASQNLGTASGSTATFPVVTPNGSTPTVQNVWRTDWQGRQRMYPTARTNYLPRSGAFSTAPNGLTSATLTGSIADPSGGTSAFTLTATAPNGAIHQYLTRTFGTYVNSVWIRRRTGTGTVKIYYPNSASLDVTAQVTANWQRLSASNAYSAGAMYWGVILGTSGDAVDIAFGQSEPGTAPTSYTPTTTAAVTVTDWSQSASNVVFASNPLAGAVIEADYSYTGGLGVGNTLTWTGAYYRRVRFDMDEMDMERIFGATAAGGGQTWEGKTVKLISVK